MVAPVPGLMDLLVQKMQYLNKAQAVHAENIANINTPGYKPMDVAPFTFGEALKQASVNVAVTNPNHIVPVSMTQANSVAMKAKPRAASDIEDVEQEATKVAQTGIDYQMITTIFHKIGGFFRIAVKGS